MVDFAERGSRMSKHQVNAKWPRVKGGGGMVNESGCI